MADEITLTRACDKIPWGFRLMGGVDFGSPLTILRLTADSVAEKRGLKVGDIVIEIGDVQTKNLTHAEAQRQIIHSRNQLRLLILRGSYPDVARAVTPIRGLTPSSLCNVEKKKTISTTSLGSVNSLLEYDSFEFIGHSDEEHLNEHHELTEEKIEEMLLENVEVIEEKGKSAMGVNFRRFIPKCDFIKDSAVFHVLQEEQVHKELSEKDQLKKCPNKRFSTFLLHPDRPVPEPKSKTQQEEREPDVPKTELEQTPISKPTNKSKSPIIITSQYESDEGNSENAVCNVESFINEKNSISETEHTELTHANEMAIAQSNGIQIEEVTDNNDLKPTDDFENQLNQIKNTLTILGGLPLLIQSQLATVQSQINQLLQLKEGQTSQITNAEITLNNENQQIEMNDFSQTKETNSDKQDTTLEIVENITSEEHIQSVQFESITEEEETEIVEQQETEENREPNEDDQNQAPALQDEDAEEREMHRRRICPLTPQPRPVVLPGGRIWRKPKDAYNEDFIAETLISQAEVLVGSTLGVNFRKYEPPKFDLSNSAVYKLIHNLEDKKGGLEERDTIPALQDYYQPPISAKHFYLASLADKVHDISDVTESN